MWFIFSFKHHLQLRALSDSAKTERHIWAKGQQTRLFSPHFTVKPAESQSHHHSHIFLDPETLGVSWYEQCWLLTQNEYNQILYLFDLLFFLLLFFFTCDISILVTDYYNQTHTDYYTSRSLQATSTGKTAVPHMATWGNLRSCSNFSCQVPPLWQIAREFL